MPALALNILLIEDNDDLRESTQLFLRQQGHQVVAVAAAEELVEIAGTFQPHVYVIDLNLPDEDGLSLTRRLRNTQPNVGIVITTARSHIGDKVTGYESGADLYMTKPVHPRELLAGLDALAKRLYPIQPQESCTVLNLRLRQLQGPADCTPLTAGEAQILSALIRAPGHMMERWQIGEILSGPEAALPTAATIEMRITRLRKKLSKVGAPAPHIKSVHKVGYTLCCPLIIRS